MNLFLMGVVGLLACGEKENDTSNTDTGEDTTDTGEETPIRVRKPTPVKRPIQAKK